MNDINRQFTANANSISESAAYQFTGSKSEAAQVISDNLLQLRRIAKEADLGFLAYLLEMSFREAFMTSVNMNLGFTGGRSAIR